MKLRHLILLVSATGACGALLLAADMYRRLKEAEASASMAASPLRDDSVLSFGIYHALGLLSLAFFFLALFLILLSAVRDRQYVAAIEGLPIPQAAPPPLEPPLSPSLQQVSAPVAVVSAQESVMPVAVPVEVVPIEPASVMPIEAPSPPAEPNRILAFEEKPPEKSDVPPPTI